MSQQWAPEATWMFSSFLWNNKMLACSPYPICAQLLQLLQGKKQTKVCQSAMTSEAVVRVFFTGGERAFTPHMWCIDTSHSKCFNVLFVSMQPVDDVRWHLFYSRQRARSFSVVYESPSLIQQRPPVCDVRLHMRTWFVLLNIRDNSPTLLFFKHLTFDSWTLKGHS